MLLGVRMLPCERKGSLRGGVDKGKVQDALDHGRHRRVDGGVLSHPVGGLARRNHKEGPYAVQSPPHRFGFFARGLGGLRSRKVGRAIYVPDDQPLAVTQAR